MKNSGRESWFYQLQVSTAGHGQVKSSWPRGGIDRIGEEESHCFVEIGKHQQQLSAHIPDHAVAVKQCLEQLTDPLHGCLQDPSEVSAIGFKAVHGGRVSEYSRSTQMFSRQWKR